MQSIGHVDIGFQPEVSKFLSGDVAEYFGIWKIPNTGLPAPVESAGNRAAVWIGQVASAHGERPVVAFCAPREEKVGFYSEGWYVGVGTKQDELRIDDDPIELALHAIYVAQHGPETFYAASRLLMSLLPFNHAS